MLNIVFSKDRELQLTAYLESLRYCYRGSLHTYVITPNEYPGIQKEFPFVKIVREGENKSLVDCIKEIWLQDDSREVLFGCDDTVFTRPFTCTHVHSRPIFAFSLRLPPPGDSSTWIANDHDKWSHYGYPFEVVGAIYRKPLITPFIFSPQMNDESIITPNDIELSGVFFFAGYHRLMMSTGARLITHQVNRVQEKHPNAFIECGSDPESCQEAYDEGKRIDWRSTLDFSRPVPDYPYADAEAFLVR